jgi:uncharacterized protein
VRLAKNVLKFRIDEARQVLLYSPLTGALDLVSPETVESLEASGAGVTSPGLSDGATAYLLDRGYAYESPAAEAAAVAAGFDEYRRRESRSNVRFVLLPTLQCNARCPYCFIGKSIGTEDLMSDAILDDAFRAMDLLAEQRGRGCTKQLSLFGGEPLIDTPAQKRLMERVLVEGSERGFVIDVVSNALDLTAYVPLLKRYGVAQVQVTFDGPRDYHDTRRRAVDGRGPSFDRIVNGVEAALTQGIRLNVRILLDRNSIEMLPELVRYFDGRGWFRDDNFRVHIGSIFDCFRCQPAKETAKHLGVREGNEKLYQICRRDPAVAELLALDWQGVGRLLSTGRFFPTAYRTCFGGTRTFAMDPGGGVYICETTAGRPEYRIGAFSPTLVLDADRVSALERRNVLNIPACQACSQALLCGGGCVFNAYVERGSYDEPGCRMIQETLEYGLNYYWPEIARRMRTPDDTPPARRPAGDACCPSRV